MENKENLSVVSLFSGAGGLDWGFHSSSRYKILLANELKAVPSETLARNLGFRVVQTPFAPSLEDLPIVVQGDIADVRFYRLQELEPTVLIGGPPCQDFSIVKGGARQGIEVKRGKLYSHFIRAVASLKPKFFVFENVPGLVSANSNRAYKLIIEDFQKLNFRWDEIKAVAQVDNGEIETNNMGYEILFSDIVDARKLGVPQGRRRLIIIGLRQDIAGSLDLFSWRNIKNKLEQQLKGEGRLLAKYPITVMEVFEGKTICELGEKYRETMMEYKTLWEDISTDTSEQWRERVWKKLTFDVMNDYLMVNSIKQANSKEIEKAINEHKEVLNKLGYWGRPVAELNTEDNSNILPNESAGILERMRRIPPGENHDFVRGTKWEVEGRGMSLIYRRPFPIKPAPTVVAYGGGGTWGYHYERRRGMLTNRERARIQTFSDEFMFFGKNSEIRAQIGEAVPPLLAREIAEAINTALDKIV